MKVPSGLSLSFDESEFDLSPDEIPEDLQRWVTPEMLRKFKPTAEQAAFQRFASKLADDLDEGTPLSREWVRLGMEAGLKISPSIWRRWCKNPLFEVWFYKDMVAAMETTAREITMYEGVWFRGLYQAMLQGHEWAFKLFHRFHWATDTGEDTREYLQAVLDFVKNPAGENKPNAWVKDKPTSS